MDNDLTSAVSIQNLQTPNRHTIITSPMVFDYSSLIGEQNTTL